MKRAGEVKRFESKVFGFMTPLDSLQSCDLGSALSELFNLPRGSRNDESLNGPFGNSFRSPEMILHQAKDNFPELRANPSGLNHKRFSRRCKDINSARSARLFLAKQDQ